MLKLHIGNISDKEKRMETKKLIDCCEFISDGDHLPPPKSDSGVPFITISNITGQNKLSFEDTMFVPESYYNGLNENKKAQKGDILYSVVGSFGKPVYVDFDKQMVFQRHIAILRPKRNVNARFIYYTMLNPQFYKLVDKLAIGCSQRTVTLDTLRNIEVNLPDKDIQDKMVGILSLIDEKIDINNNVNDNLEQQAKLIYDYWFTQFDFPDENGKPYCSSGGKMVWNEQLKRNIPENWKVAQLKDIFNVSGKPISRDDCQTDAYYTPIDVIPKRTMTFAGGLSAAEANSSLQVYEENNILLGAMRVYFHRVCISAQSGITRTTTLVLKPKVDEYLGYAYQVLNDDNAILYATQHSSGTQQPYIKWNDVLENYRFAMPSNPKLLYEYSKISEPLITKAKNCARETEQLRKLRDWLLPMLMNGQATISD